MAAKSTEVATVEEPSTEVAVNEELSAEERALIEANQAEADASEFQIPILKLAQPLTDEVTSGNAKAGEYVLGLTGQTFEGPFEFIVAGKGKGRFRPGRDGNRTLTAYDTNTVPEHWDGDDPLVGTPFSEHPDAEEQWSIVHAKDWGSGPPIQTTHNYTGYIVGEDFPVRISLRRTSAPAARKLNTLLDAVLRGRYWDKTILISAEQQKNDKGAFYVATVAVGRPTTQEEKQEAIKLALVIRSKQITTVGDDTGDEPTVEPDAAGGLSV